MESTPKSAIELLLYFSTKRNAQGLMKEGINYAIYNDLFSRQLLEFSDGKGTGLFIQISPRGKEILSAVVSTDELKPVVKVAKPR